MATRTNTAAKTSAQKTGELKKTTSPSAAKKETKSAIAETKTETSSTSDPFESKEEVKVEESKTTVANKTEESNPGEWVVNTTKFEKDTEIIFSTNPKRNGCASWLRYEKYSKAKTFGEYLELNAGKFSMADARYDVQKKFLRRLADATEA